MFEAGASEESGAIPNGTWGTDTLHLNTSYALSSFPVDLYNNFWNFLGLGENSTFLNALIASGAIRSRTWSIYWGWAGLDKAAQMDGIAVFGDYDQAKITGQNMTVPLTKGTSCDTNLVVTLASLDMQFPNGQIINLQNSSLKYCLDPSYGQIAFQPDVVNNFISKAGGTFLRSSMPSAANTTLSEQLGTPIYLSDKVFDGDLNFTFENGPSIIIPNNQLILPNYEVDYNGSVTFNESERMIPISSGFLSDINRLGMPLFSSMYLLLTQETDPPALVLWQSKNNATNDFAAIDDQAEGNICTSSGFSGSVFQSSTSGSSARGKSNRLSSGAIAGIAVSATVLLIAVVAFLVLRKKRRTRSSASNRDSPSDVATELLSGYGGMGMKAELSSHAQAKKGRIRDTDPAELPEFQTEPQELDSESHR